jgi:hypothetical protein
MSVPTSVLDALQAGGVPWPGPLTASARAGLEDLLAGLPEDGRTQVVGAVLDPERNAWGRAAMLTLDLLLRRGARFTGFATDEVLEFVDSRGERFGAVPLAFALPPHPGGREVDVTRMLAALDGAFGPRRYAVWLRRPLPTDVDVEPIRRAVHLWLGALDRGDRTESHAVYEDDDIALDLTVLPAPRAAEGARVVTVMPLPSLERLAAVDGRVVESAARAEELAGALPLVCCAVADRPWRVSRGYLQQLLYGTPDRVEITIDGDRRTYEAEFTATGRSMFSDPACARVAEVSWLAPGAGPLDATVLALQNPWARHAPALRSGGRTFAVRSGASGARKAVLKWEDLP